SCCLYERVALPRRPVPSFPLSDATSSRGTGLQALFESYKQQGSSCSSRPVGAASPGSASSSSAPPSAMNAAGYGFRRASGVSIEGRRAGVGGWLGATHAKRGRRPFAWPLFIWPSRPRCCPISGRAQ
ncbi:unnamed protein product, partial [Amoebophrya sp. A120]